MSHIKCHAYCVVHAYQRMLMPDVQMQYVLLLVLMSPVVMSEVLILSVLMSGVFMTCVLMLCVPMLHVLMSRVLCHMQTQLNFSWLE